MDITRNPPSKLVFKPRFMHQDFLLSRFSHLLHKRNYKFAHSLRIDHKEHEVHTIPKLKYLTSIDHRSGYSLKNLPRWKKFIKPYRKYLRNVKGNFQCFPIQKLLPLLSELKLSLEESSSRWRLLFSRSAFRRLMFDFAISAFSRSRYNLQSLLQKYKAQLARNLSRMKDLNQLTIKVSKADMEVIICMLKMFSSKICPDSLKHFHLYLESYNNSEAVTNFNGAFRFVTSLDVDGIIFSPFLSSAGEFKNLNNLRVLYLFHTKPWDPRHFGCLKDFSSLKKLTFSLLVNSFTKEREFLENFSLPSTLEHLNLSLRGFTWSENKWDDEAIQNGFDTNTLYTQFYEKLQNCKGLKTLHLRCRDDMGGFSRRFIQQFTQLEEFVFHSEQSSSGGRIEPVIFQDYWGALARSKETLISLSIQYPRIAFPEKMDLLEAGFPKLEKLHLQAFITPSHELGAFCKRFPSLNDIWLDSIQFSDIKKLEYFLMSWRLIPQKMKVMMRLDASTIRKKPLTECLTKFILEAKIRGELEMNLTTGKSHTAKSWKELVDLTQEKCSLDQLDLHPRKGSIGFYRRPKFY